MQLEALQLLRNQRQQGFEEGSSHEGVEVKLAGYRPLRVKLTGDGRVHSLSPFSKDDAAGYWSLITGPAAKKQRFPALRLDPLIRLDADATDWPRLERVGREAVQDSDFSDVVALLLAYLAEGARNDLALRPAWEEKALPLLSLDSPHAGHLLERVLRLVRAFGLFAGLGGGQSTGATAGIDPGEALIAAASAWVPTISDVSDLEAAVQLIVGKRVKKKGGIGLNSVQCCFDIHEPDEPMATVYTARTRSMMASCLPASDSLGTCSLTGRTGPLLAEKFPIWTGKVRVYSKNVDARCNQRYRRAGVDGFPISEDAARAITDALSQMIDASREGKTWTYLYNGKGQRTERGWKEDRGDWLLAYPSFPVGSLHTIDIFQPPTDDLRLLRRFEDLAETLCSQLKRQAPAGPTIPPYLQVLLIRKVSEGQIQLVFSDQTPVSRLSAAIAAWRVDNLPPGLRIPVPSKSRDGLTSVRPRILFPGEIARLLSHQWVRAGIESARLEGPPIGLIFELFLKKPGVWEQNASQLLDVTLMRTAPLLKGLGHLLHRSPREIGGGWQREWLDLFPRTPAGQPDGRRAQPGRSFVDSLSLIGSLLFAMNSTADHYTTESAYLVGRLLAMMDELHRCYCVVERKGDLPPTLLGNGLLGRAADAPALAIEELLDRSRIYLGWAKTAVPGDAQKEGERIAIFSARKVLRLAGPLTEQLHRAELSGELSALRKAHLFLGYLSPVLGGDEEKPDREAFASGAEPFREGEKET